MTAAAAATAAALYRVRTITAFLQLPRDESKWEPLLADAGEFLTAAQRSLEALGYEVQTTRLATQPFPEFLRLAGDDDAALIAQRAAALEAAAARHGIRLLSLGAASDPRDLAVLPALIAATAATSVSYALPPDAGRELLSAVAATVLEIAAATDDGLGAFRFAAASAVPPGVPYFPVASAGRDLHRCFALGTESDALLLDALSRVRGCAGAALVNELTRQLAPLEAAALQLAGEDGSGDNSSNSSSNTGTGGWRYLGMDTSVAPGLDTPPLTSAIEQLLGPGRSFGQAGTLGACAAITAALKGLPLRRTGYCGLMLAVCEDKGLAAAVANGSVQISTLLCYSAVCGCGLDTVPVPGPSGDDPDADAAAQRGIAGVLADCNALAHRLQKPLACRLLPLPQKRPGDPTGFDHPYMVNAVVMDLER